MVLRDLFQRLFALVLLLVLSPLFIFVAIAIRLETEGSALFLQERVGKDGAIFKLFKFRTMLKKAEEISVLTAGNTDSRITKVGRFIRELHIDEMLQLVNVLKGDMNLIGPRPTVAKYTEYYPEKWKKVLSVKPGITGFASVTLADYEYNKLKNSKDHELTYIEDILPKKLDAELKYLKYNCIKTDLKIILMTALRIFGIKYKFKFN